jgi:ribosomal protein S18 acetylase RimI-like enzyme
MEEYSIIRLMPEDYYKCNNIWDMTKQEKMALKWYDELMAGNRVIFVYTVDGAYIAEGSLMFDSGDCEYTIPGQRVYLSRMIVKKEYRNQGIGHILLDYLVEHARSLGYTEMSIGVDTDNIRARHLYEKKGFTTVLFEGKDEFGEYVKLLKRL